MAKRNRSARSKKSHTRHIQLQILRREQMSIIREAEYIITCAINNDSRLVQLGVLILFSTDTGDAWMLDTGDRTALCLARGGERRSYNIQETADNFAIDWNADYRIEGQAFIVAERTGHVSTIMGYPTAKILQATAGRL